MEKAVISAISNGSSTQDFTHSGSWQPKVAIFQWSRANTSADTFQEHASVGYGFTDGTNERSIATASEDNAARGDSARIQRDNCLIVTLNPSGTIETVDAVATFNSWLSNGIRINWTDQPAANFYITCTLLGGSEITDVLVGTFMTTTGSGDVSYTSASFQADYGMFLSGGTGTLNSPVVAGSMMLGMATGTSGNVSQWVQSIHSVDNPATMSTRQYYSDSKIFEIHTTATDGYATFSGFTSNGFTVNIGDTFSTSFPIFFLIIKGGAFSVGSATEIGSVTTQEITVNKNVGVVGIFGIDTGTPDAVQTGCMWTSGFADGTNQYVDVFEDTHGTADSIVVSRHDTNQIYLNITANATATSSTLDDEADRYALGSSSFTLNWTNIGQARPFRYCTYGTGIVHNEKTLTLRHAIDAKYNKTLTLRHDVREKKSKTLSLRHRIWGQDTPVMTQVVTFRKDSSGTNDVTQEIPLAFTPKALMLTSAGNTVENTISSHFQHIEGFSDGTNQACCAIGAKDASDVSDSSCCHRNDSVFMRLNDTQPSNIESRATVSFGTNKVTFTWVQNDTNPTLITIWVLGGNAIKNSKVNTVIIGSAGTGVKNYTGLGWNPAGMGKSVVFLMSVGTQVMPFTGGVGISYCKGVGLKTITNGNISCDISLFNADAVTTSNSGRRFDSGRSVTIINSANGATYTLGIFNSWITDGFSINYTQNSYPNFYISYLVIEGGTWDLCIPTAPTQTGTNQITFPAGVGTYQMRAVHVFSENWSNNSLTTHSSITSAFFDSVESSCISAIDVDNLPITDAYKISRKNDSNIWSVFDTSGNIVVDARFVSFDSGTQITVDYVATTSDLFTFFFIVVADGPEHIAKTLALRYAIDARYNKPLTLRHDIREQKADTLTARYDIRQLMSKTLTLRHDIMQKLAKTLTLLYNIEVQLQHLDKSLTLRHDIREQKNTQLTLRHDIAERIAKTLTLLYGIRQQESKTLTLRHDIAEKINKQLTLLYDIAQKNEKTLTLIYNLNQRIESTLTLRYDLLQKLDKELTLLYDILEKKEVSLTLKYDIVGRLSKTLTLLYDIEVQGMQHFEKQLSLLYNIAERKNKSFTFRYDLLQQLNKELTLLHNILEQKSKQTTLRYDIREQKNTELTVRHDIREQKTNQLSLRYNIFERLVKTLTLKYNILVNLSKTLTLRQDIREQKQKELTLRYDIIGRLSKTLTLLYNIEVQGMQHLEKELSLLYNIMEKKSSQVTLRYNVLQRMQQQFTLRYNILQKFADQLTMRYDIRQSFNKSLTLRYNVLQQFARQLSIRYDILAKVSKQLTTRYDIRQKLDRTLSLRYGIRIRNENQLTLRYDIIGRLQKTLTLIYNVESLLPHFVKTFTMRYDIREKKSQTLAVRYNILQKLSKTFRLRFRIHPKGFVESDHAVMNNKQKDMFNKSDFTWNILDHLSKIKWSRKKGWYIEKP